MSRRVSACSTVSRQHGFSVLEVLVIVAIVSVIAALAVPRIHTKAREAFLDSNMRSLASTVQDLVLEGFDSAYRSTDDGGADTYISTNLETSLRESAGKAQYVNPYARSTTSRTIINSSTVAGDPAITPPAVFVTDNPACRYDSFDSQLDVATRRQLAGTIMVQFNAPEGRLDVFFVDGAGNRSAQVVHVPLA
jgi:type II secretory pathway pseudopilin PulG